MSSLQQWTGNTAQAQIVTCSGALNTGSLRVIRNGVDLEELAIVNDMSHAKYMWPLRFRYEEQCVNYHLVPFLH